MRQTPIEDDDLLCALMTCLGIYDDPVVGVGDAGVEFDLSRKMFAALAKAPGRRGLELTEESYAHAIATEEARLRMERAKAWLLHRAKVVALSSRAELTGSLPELRAAASELFEAEMQATHPEACNGLVRVTP